MEAGQKTGAAALKDKDPDPYDRAIVAVLAERGRRTSTSLLQRRLSTGYGRCALWLFWMEAEGIVSPIRDNYRRDVLAWRH